MNTSFVYERLYKEYRPVVYSYISARLSSREDAEDLCQHVFVKLYKALETFDISLIDHVIICDDRFFSFSDDRVYLADRPA